MKFDGPPDSGVLMPSPDTFVIAEQGKEIARIAPGSEITAYDAATIATSLTVEQVEEIVRGLAPADVPLLLRRLDQATTLINTAKKVATLRMLEDGRLGEEWTSPEGETYRFEQTKRGEFSDISGLLHVLDSLGVSISDIGRAVSGLRVGDLDTAVATLTDPEKRKEAQDTVNAHRTYREGTARLEALNNPYRRKR